MATRWVFLVLVPDRTRGTLEHFILQFIAPGSIINSDGFASYNNIINLNVQPCYQHNYCGKSFIIEILGRLPFRSTTLI